MVLQIFGASGGPKSANQRPRLWEHSNVLQDGGFQAGFLNSMHLLLMFPRGTTGSGFPHGLHVSHASIGRVHLYKCSLHPCRLLAFPRSLNREFPFQVHLPLPVTALHMYCLAGTCTSCILPHYIALLVTALPLYCLAGTMES